MTAPLALGGGKQRSLLAVLLAHANETVSSERLVDALVGRDAAADGGARPSHQVSGLRKVLGDGRLITRAPGYALRVEPSELDADRFERLVTEAESRGADRARPAMLREALELWRGPPLDDVADEPFARRRSAGSRSCGWRRSSCDRSRPRRRAGTRDLIAELRRSSPPHRCASACTRS